MLRRERATNSGHRRLASDGISELGSVSSQGILRSRGPSIELDSGGSPQELESGAYRNSLSSSQALPKSGTGK